MSDWRVEEWEKFGRSDPYFGVISDRRMHAEVFDDAARAEFFASGQRDFETMRSVMPSVNGADFTPRRALEFGCGVGRVTIPLARWAGEVTAVDASESMLRIAEENCRLAGVTNVRFVHSTSDRLSVGGPFDFVYSYIVFQHIPPQIGYALFASILASVAPGGSGLLHVTTDTQRSWPIRFLRWARRESPLVHRLLNRLQGRRPDWPLMAMFEYDLATLKGMLARHGMHRVVEHPTNHAGHLGVMLAFVREG